MIKSLQCKVNPLSAFVTVGMLLVISIFHYVFFHYEVEMINEEISLNERSFNELKWDYIEGTIVSATNLAQLTADTTAKQISADIQMSYPDMKVLKSQFDNDNYNPVELNKIIINDIKGKYLYGIQNGNNDIFVLSRKGIVADLDTTSSTTINRSFQNEIKSHYNKTLSDTAFNLLVTKHHALVFYEPDQPNVSSHKILCYPKLSELKNIFLTEGLDGLTGYTFLIPSYITEDGDIFGEPDISMEGSKTFNHKLIVVQSFNIMDVMNRIHPNAMNILDNESKKIKSQLYEQLRFKSLVYLSILILNVIILLFIIFLIKVKCPNKDIIGNTVKEDDSTV